MVKLGVNVDHVAQMRQARRGSWPDPVEFALIAERCGADGITVHLREDRRHIQDEDVLRLRKVVRTKLNLEMAATPYMVDFVCKVKVDDVCLVPEKREELTTEGGLDIMANRPNIKKCVDHLKKKGICTSIFVDPEPEMIQAAFDVGADCVELHTGSYADAKTRTQRAVQLQKLVRAGKVATELGLMLNAGHGLDYENVKPVSKIFGMHELNIGYSIVVRALEVGFYNAVKEMRRLVQ